MYNNTNSTDIKTVLGTFGVAAVICTFTAYAHMIVKDQKTLISTNQSQHVSQPVSQITASQITYPYPPPNPDRKRGTTVD